MDYMSLKIGDSETSVLRIFGKPNEIFINSGKTARNDSFKSEKDFLYVEIPYYLEYTVSIDKNGIVTGKAISTMED